MVQIMHQTTLTKVTKLRTGKVPDTLAAARVQRCPPIDILMSRLTYWH
jgi:hypothetical protein